WFRAHPGAVRCMTYDAGGDWLFSGGSEPGVRRWHAPRPVRKGAAPRGSPRRISRGPGRFVSGAILAALLAGFLVMVVSTLFSSQSVPRKDEVVLPPP